ncbi:plakophilin-3-like isoform X2 [Paramormyrops kingsleyae]|uniref:plakophilin-3-like isoform X2 n=1 Tax=Paramormyrops kingsleyae TaxID=1676925 RepID=UPI000CD6187A|nr:plakophilin-3-like isoform X1 [Paramormyrops kingsleyae]
MAASVASESVFLSVLQPNNSAVTSYAVPSELQLEHGGSLSDEVAKARRVQQQVQLRLAEKSSVSSGTLPRMNGSVSNYAASDYGGTTAMKFSTYSPGFSSRSQMYSVNRTLPPPRVSQYSSGYSTGFSSRSAVDFGPRMRPSVAGVAGGGTYQEELPMAGYQTSHQQVLTRTPSRPDPETMSLHSMRMYSMPPQPNPVSNWVAQDGSEGSLLSEREAGPYQAPVYATTNGYSTQVRQVSSAPSTMRRSLSGTLGQAMMSGGATTGEIVQQQSFKGPAFRTISRINNRTNRLSIGSMASAAGMQQQVSGSVYGSSGRMAMGQMVSGGPGSMVLMQQRQATLPRTLSVKSLHSVGRGVDVMDNWNMTGSMSNLNGFTNMDMNTAVNYLNLQDPEMQVPGAAYIQHECYHNREAKDQVRQLGGIPALVQLLSSDNQEVQRYATGAMRNIIYENMDNKAALIEAGGIPQLVNALAVPDDELRKNITGILWNLSSKDNLKEKLAKETLGELTKKILIPLVPHAPEGGSEVAQPPSPSEVDIFYNTTGCLRNLSSVNEKTRQQMRETSGLVDSLVTYIQSCIDSGKMEEKGVENSVCVLRNLSYQLYSEMPTSVQLRLEGPTRGQDDTKNDPIGCFTPQSKKAKDRQNQDISTFTEVSKVPKGQEWLWHPQVVRLYNQVLQRCDINAVTREAAAGALQNITAGDKRWASILSKVALEQERILPVLMDHLRTDNDLELRSLTGFLRNLSRHTKDKGDLATKLVSNLLTKLPIDGYQKDPSTDVVVNICGTLNNLVAGSSVAARDITYFDGLKKLVGIKNSHDSSPAKLKAAKAAATVLCNMFQYKKLHRDYKQKGFGRQDFADIII